MFTPMITLQDPATSDMVCVAYDGTSTPDQLGYAGWTIVCTQDGLPPEGGVIENGAWVVPLATLQDRAWEQVKAIREETLLTATTPFGIAQTDTDSMVKINGSVSMAMLAKQSATAYSATFTLADNSTVDMDADQMISFGVAVGTHVADVYARGRDLRDAIYAATTADDLAAIDLTSGWPS